MVCGWSRSLGRWHFDVRRSAKCSTYTRPRDARRRKRTTRGRGDLSFEERRTESIRTSKNYCAAAAARDPVVGWVSDVRLAAGGNIPDTSHQCLSTVALNRTIQSRRQKAPVNSPSHKLCDFTLIIRLFAILCESINALCIAV